MEARCLQIQQKKADEEKLLEGKKMKEDSDRCKREREDLTERKALKQNAKVTLPSFYRTPHADFLTRWKIKRRRSGRLRKPRKSQRIRKSVLSEIKKTTVTFKIGKPTLTMQLNASQSNLLSKSLKQSSLTMVLNKSVKATSGSSQSSSLANAKGKGKEKALDDDLVEQPVLAMHGTNASGEFKPSLQTFQTLSTCSRPASQSNCQTSTASILTRKMKIGSVLLILLTGLSQSFGRNCNP